MDQPQDKETRQETSFIKKAWFKMWEKNPVRMKKGIDFSSIKYSFIKPKTVIKSKN